MWSNCINFVNQIFNGSDSMLWKTIFNEFIVRKRNSLFIDFPKSSFVDELLYSFSRRISKLNIFYPKVMYGSTLLRRLTEALLSLTKVPLCNCLRRRSLRILTIRGFSLLIPRILMTKATLASAATWICPVSLACLLAFISAAT